MDNIGINPTQVDDTPGFKIGDCSGYDDPTDGHKEFFYGSAVTVMARGLVAVEGIAVGAMSSISTTNSAPGGLGGHGSRVGVAQATMAIGQFGWFQILGKGPVEVGALAAVGTRLNTTGTVGRLDDDGTASSEAVNGINVKTVQGAVAGVNEDGRMEYPTVGATL